MLTYHYCNELGIIQLKSVPLFLAMSVDIYKVVLTVLSNKVKK